MKHKCEFVRNGNATTLIDKSMVLPSPCYSNSLNRSCTWWNTRETVSEATRSRCPRQVNGNEPWLSLNIAETIKHSPWFSLSRIICTIYLFPQNDKTLPTACRLAIFVYCALLVKIVYPYIVYPPKGGATHSPDGVHLTVFPIYMPQVNENWGFKNTNIDRPFSKCRKPLLSGWVGGWWYFGSFDFPQIQI